MASVSRQIRIRVALIFFDGEEQQLRPLHTAAVGLEDRTLPKPMNLVPTLVAQRMDRRWFHTQANQIPSHILWERSCWRRGFIEVMICNKLNIISSQSRPNKSCLVVVDQLSSIPPTASLPALWQKAAYIEVCRQAPVVHYQPLGSEQQVSPLNFLMETLWGSSGPKEQKQTSPFESTAWNPAEQFEFSWSTGDSACSVPLCWNSSSAFARNSEWCPELDIHRCSVLLSLALPSTRETVCHSAWRGNGRAHNTRLNIYWKLWSNQSLKSNY